MKYNNRVSALGRALGLIQQRFDEMTEQYPNIDSSSAWQKKGIPQEALDEYEELRDSYRMINADVLEYKSMMSGHQVDDGDRHDDFTETHPSYAVISVTRPQGGDGIFFGCQSRHDHFISMTVSHASRVRGLSYDRIHSEKDILEVQMSYEQWAKVVSGVAGQACPVTLTHYRGERLAPPEQLNNNTLHMKEFLAEVDKIRELIDEELPNYCADILKASGPITKGARVAIADRITSLKSRFSSGNGFAFLSTQYLEFVEQVENELKVDVEAWLKHAIAQRDDDTKLIDG